MPFGSVLHSGQSVPHVHIHILPRHPSDFEPIDGIYDKLDSVDIATDFHTIRDRAQTAKAKLKMDSERQPVSWYTDLPCAIPIFWEQD